jgi:tRNA threonylcarbamoyladenosine biosynthesis protein TsaB
MDARMQEVYYAVFKPDGQGLVRPVSAEQVCPPAILAVDDTRNTPGASIGAGNGFDNYPEMGRVREKLTLFVPDCWPRAGAVCRLAASWLEENSPLPAAQAQPVYIRDKVADKPT